MAATCAITELRNRGFVYRAIVSVTMILLAMAAMASLSLAAPAPIGEVTALRGEASISRDGQLLLAKKESKLFLNDKIQTGESSRVKLRFNDDSILTLSDNTLLDIKEYFYDAAARDGHSIFELLDGQLRTLVGKGKKLQIHTPTAVAAARGTFFFVRVKSVNGLPTTEIFLLQGGLKISNSSGDIAGEILLEPGMFTTVVLGEPPSPPEPISEAQFKELINCSEIPHGEL